MHKKLSIPGTEASAEIYRALEAGSARYITVTGLRLEGTPDELADLSAAMDEVYADLEPKQKKARPSAAKVSRSGSTKREPRSRPREDDRLGRVIRDGCYEDWGGNRSDAVFWVANEMVRRGATDEQITEVLLNRGNKISEHILEQDDRERAVRRVIEKARARAAEEVDDAEARVAKINEEWAFVLAGGKPVMMKFCGDKFEFVTREAFTGWFENKPSVMIGDKTVPIAKFWMQHPDRRSYEGLEFEPDLTKQRDGYYNLWRGFAFTARKGDCSKFLAHLRDNICCGNEELYNWVLGWFAAIFQRPTRKSGTSLVLRGGEGVGKTIVGKIFGELLGYHYTTVADVRFITGRFNSHMAHLLLLQGDEAFWAGAKDAEGKLKDLITGTEHLIEYKGLEAVRMKNHVRLLLTSNHDWVVPAGPGARRFAVLDVGNAHKEDRPYFKAIVEQTENGGYEALLWELLNFDLSTVDVGTVPRTQALLEQQIESMTPLQSWLLSLLKTGTLPSTTEQPNVCSKVVLFERYKQHTREQGVSRRSVETAVATFLQNYFPSLRTERRQLSGKRTYVYVFPPLPDCRRAFVRALGQNLPWGEDWEEEKWEPDWQAF